MKLKKKEKEKLKKPKNKLINLKKRSLKTKLY